MHFQISNATLESLKTVFNISKRKSSLGAPVKAVQEQAQSTRSIKLTCHRYFNFLLKFRTSGRNNGLKLQEMLLFGILQGGLSHHLYVIF